MRSLTRPGDTEATGSAEFVEGVKARLGLKARHRRIHKENSAVYALQEPLAAYSPDFEGKNEVLRAKNRLLWNIFDNI